MALDRSDMVVMVALNESINPTQPVDRRRNQFALPYAAGATRLVPTSPVVDYELVVHLAPYPFSAPIWASKL
jgi:hypothetical protein